MPALNEPSPLSLLDCNSTVIRRASRHLTRLYDREFAAVGLRTTQVVILALAAEGPLCTIPDLARALVMDRSTLGHALRPLERDGLIAISPGERDRRKRLIALTPEGFAQLKIATAIWTVAQAKFDAEFGKVEAGRMRDMMVRVIGLTFVDGDP